MTSPQTTWDRINDAAFMVVANNLDRAAKKMAPWFPGGMDYTKINVIGLVLLLAILAGSLTVNLVLLLTRH